MDEVEAKVTIPRSIPLLRSDITCIKLHGFADASLNGCSAVIHAVVRQGNEINQGVFVSKSRLSKRDLIIPRLELVSCHLLSNLLSNSITVLDGMHISLTQVWTDSTVWLHWISGGGTYKQLETYRVRKINEKEHNWRHVLTAETLQILGAEGPYDLQETQEEKDRNRCHCEHSRGIPL